MHRILFLDDVEINRTTGVERRGHAARRYRGNPLFTRQFPWERMRLQLYGRCVLHDPELGLYRMYYLSQPCVSHYPNIRVGRQVKVGFATLPSYAESRDGIHWERPLRPDVPFEDVPLTNLLDLGLGQSFEPGLLYDGEDPDPRRRYKAFVWDQRFRLPRPGKLQHRRALPTLAFPRGLILSQQIVDEAGAVVYEERYDDQGIAVAFSADGIRWQTHPDWVLRCYSDTGHSVLYEPGARRYVAYGRFNQQKDSPAFHVGRNVARVESTDFVHWSAPELVLTGDEEDPDSFQINSMPVDRYEGIYIGLMEVDVRPHPHPHRPLQLATSRDGRHWTRVADRQPCIEEASPGAWDCDVGEAGLHPPPGGTPPGHSFVRPAGGLFPVGDEVRMYYSNTSGPDPLCGVGMATWRRDGFVSLYAGPGGGEVLTRAFVPDGPELHLNVDASAGEVTVRGGDFQGRPLPGWRIDQPSARLRGDHVDVVVRWPDSDFGQRVGKATTLRIALRDAHLYSIWTE